MILVLNRCSGITAVSAAAGCLSWKRRFITGITTDTGSSGLFFPLLCCRAKGDNRNVFFLTAEEELKADIRNWRHFETVTFLVCLKRTTSQRTLTWAVVQLQTLHLHIWTAQAARRLRHAAGTRRGDRKTWRGETVDHSACSSLYLSLLLSLFLCLMTSGDDEQRGRKREREREGEKVVIPPHPLKQQQQPLLSFLYLSCIHIPLPAFKLKLNGIAVKVQRETLKDLQKTCSILKA